MRTTKITMRTTKTLRRILAATLAIVMTMALTVSAFAAETDMNTTDAKPDLEAIAAMYADWDGSYELPDLSELSEEDQETVKAMVDAIMLAREAEAQAQAETETEAETDVPLTVSFSDVPTSHTFYKGIIYCATKGIVNGYPDGTFQPAKTVTRSHFCAMLARGFYPDQIAKYDTDWYKTEYGTFGPTNMTLSANGTLNDTSFRWSFNDASAMNTGINRYDMAQLMVNIMRAKGFTASTSQKNAAQSKITDYKNIPSKYQDAVKTVYALGIITGYANGTFGGNNIMNRGQAAIVIQRMAQYAPVKGDQGNDQYDDGTEQKPSTSNPGTSSGNTGSSTGNTGSTGSSTGTTTTKPETKPETPATPTLTNGKAITESNVLAILNELKAKWNKQDLGTYSQGNASPVRTITNRYTGTGGRKTSTTSGCGGGAARVFDAIFGQNATLRPVAGGYDDARPGDLLIKLDTNGKLTHVAIVCGRGTVNGIPNTITTVDANVGSNSTNTLVWGMGRYNPVVYDDPWTYEFYTAYPD